MNTAQASTLRHEFRPSAAKPKTKRKKRIPPVSVRFNADERAWLEERAAGMSLSGFIRDAVLENSKPKRRPRQQNPVQDYQAYPLLFVR